LSTPETDADEAGRRREILERLARKEIGAEEAAEALRDLGRAG
jgi:DNA-binding transcriptional ArsR family regulator